MTIFLKKNLISYDPTDVSIHMEVKTVFIISSDTAKVPIASIPRDLHVEYDLYADPEFALVNVSWKEPISVNGEIKSYSVAITKVVNEVRTLIGEPIKVGYIVESM